MNDESRYLLVQNVAALGVTKDLLDQLSLYGNIEEYVSTCVLFPRLFFSVFPHPKEKVV